MMTDHAPGAGLTAGPRADCRARVGLPRQAWAFVALSESAPALGSARRDGSDAVTLADLRTAVDDRRTAFSIAIGLPIEQLTANGYLPATAASRHPAFRHPRRGGAR